MTAEEPKSQVFGLFATPLRRVERALDAQLVAGLVERFGQSARQQNAQSDRLMHTQPVAPHDHKFLQQASRLITPHVGDFGVQLLGERLNWSIKEMWINVLENGGRQAMHNHANSFISGVLYLTVSHPSANTVFIKAPGGSDFIFNNTNKRAQLGPYNSAKWVSPDPAPGDMVLFPSYLLHEVPTNLGERRISLAFNAIPNRLDSWGYTLTLSR